MVMRSDETLFHVQAPSRGPGSLGQWRRGLRSDSELCFLEHRALEQGPSQTCNVLFPGPCVLLRPDLDASVGAFPLLVMFSFTYCSYCDRNVRLASGSVVAGPTSIHRATREPNSRRGRGSDRSELNPDTTGAITIPI